MAFRSSRSKQPKPSALDKASGQIEGSPPDQQERIAQARAIAIPLADLFLEQQGHLSRGQVNPFTQRFVENIIMQVTLAGERAIVEFGDGPSGIILDKLEDEAVVGYGSRRVFVSNEPQILARVIIGEAYRYATEPPPPTLELDI
jgi:hypothetical protein